MLKIWGRISSSNVMKVVWLCEELGIPFTREDVGGEFGRTRDAFYLAMNPNSRVPTIEEADGYSLWESNSILRYLCNNRAPQSPLYPSAPQARADVERWMDWQLASLNGPMTPLFWTFVRTPAEKRDLAAAARAREEAQTLWAIVDRQLAGKAYIAGAFSLADIAIGIYLHRWFALPIERGELVNLPAWYDRLRADHPAFDRLVTPPLV